MASQEGSVLVQSRSKYSLALRTRDSSCSSPSNLKLSSLLVGGILRMKGMKIETSASCLPGHFRSAADRTRHPKWNFLEDFSRHTCPVEGSQPPFYVLAVAQSCGTHVRVVYERVVCVYVDVRSKRTPNAPVFAKGVASGADGYT